MEYPVLVNNELYVIKDTPNKIEEVKRDDELLLQYIIKLIRKGIGPKISPYDVDKGFLNIQRLEEASSSSLVDFDLTKDATECNEDFEQSEVFSDPLIDLNKTANDGTNSTTCEVWTNKGLPSENDNDATQLLLELRSSHWYTQRFDDKKTIKLTLWKMIAHELNKKGFIASAEKCRQKYLNLTKKYTEFVRQCKQTGNKRVNPPPFYDLLHKILGNKDKIKLTDVHDTLELGPSLHSNVQESLNTPGISSKGPPLEAVHTENFAQNSMTTDRSLINISTGVGKKNSGVTVTKANILRTIVECNNKTVEVQRESTEKVIGEIKEQNNLLQEQVKQKDRLIDIFEKIASQLQPSPHQQPENRKRHKRKRSPDDSGSE